MRRGRRRAGRRAATRSALLAGGCALAVAACSATVPGRGTFVPGGGSATAAPPGSGHPGNSPTGSATTPATSPSPSRPSAASRDRLSCAGGRVISPAGAPYCYLAPAGFTDVSSTVTVHAGNANEKFRTAVAVANRDLIITTVYPLNRDVDPIGDDVLAAQLGLIVGQLTQQGFVFDSTVPRRGHIDGARSFAYHARTSKDQLQIDVYFIFRASTEVEVNCQWQTRATDVQRGCGLILASLQIKARR